MKAFFFSVTAFCVLFVTAAAMASKPIFRASLTHNVPGSPNSIATGNWDGDGDIDLAVANFNSDNVSILFNNGDWTFEDHQLCSVGSGPCSIVAINLDGDGDIDLAVASNADRNISILLNDNGVFEANGTVTLPAASAWSVSITAGDLDYDGDNDLVTADFYLSGQVFLWLNNGDDPPTFTEGVGKSGIITATSVTACDFDGDNKIDIAVACGFLLVYREYLPGGFNEEKDGVYSVGGYSVKSCYIDNDAYPDLATVTNSGASVYLNNGNGTFGDKTTYAAGTDPRSLAAIDFDGDDDCDLAVMNEGDNTISVLFNTAGSFGDDVPYPVSDLVKSILASDMDGDGENDIIAGVDNDPGSDNVLILYNRSGAFMDDRRYAVTGEPHSNPHSVTATDLNNDGYNDLVVTNYLTSTMSVFMNNGDGTYASDVVYSVGHGPYTCSASDLDGDGWIDVAVANCSTDDISVFFNDENGNGGLVPQGTYGAGNGPIAIVSRDFDDDGSYDLAVNNYYSNDVSVLLNNGDGTFAADVLYDVEETSWGMISEDLDEDGYFDLVVTNTGSDDISVLLNNGDGTFAEDVTYGVGVHPRWVTSSDLDGDGDLDLAVANEDSDDISILMNLTQCPVVPIITSIEDVPSDQGEQVRVSWNRVGCDRIGAEVTVEEYAVFRRIDYGLGSLGASAEAEKNQGESPVPRDEKGVMLLYPEGDWDYLASVPACGERKYSVIVQTLANSPPEGDPYYSVLFVRALTSIPGIYFDSPPDSGCSVDNLACEAVSGFAVTYNGAGGNELSWNECEDEDFQCFRIYRSEDEDFEPSPENLVYSTAETEWPDTVEEGWRYHYKITTVDLSGNESAAQGPEMVTGTDEPETPASFALYQNFPNPFNPPTTIGFDLPVSTKVILAIHDVRGGRVRILLNSLMTGGRKSVEWDGKSDEGRAVESGVYFYRLSAGCYDATKKMTLLR